MWQSSNQEGMSGSDGATFWFYLWKQFCAYPSGPPIFLCELRDGVDSSDCLRIRDRSLEYGKALISSGTLTSELWNEREISFKLLSLAHKILTYSQILWSFLDFYHHPFPNQHTQTKPSNNRDRGGEGKVLPCLKGEQERGLEYLQIFVIFLVTYTILY